MILYAVLLRQTSLCGNCNCLVCSFCHETTMYLTVQVFFGRIGSVLSLNKFPIQYGNILICTVGNVHFIPLLRIRDVYSGSRIQGQRDSGSQKPKKLFLSFSANMDLDFFYPSRIPGSKRHQIRIPDPDPQHWFILMVTCHGLGSSVAASSSGNKKKKEARYLLLFLTLILAFKPSWNV